MKKAFALVIVVLLLAAMAAPAVLAADSATVTVSVSVNGELVVAAQPVTVSELTVDAVIKAAHAAYYPDGEAGYAAGVDSTWNMWMISQCWGTVGTPYVVLNGAPLGAGENAAYISADAAPVKDGDNLILSISGDMAIPALAVSLTPEVADGTCTLTATNWVMDFMTFQYAPYALAGYEVTDGDGNVLGVTDDAGKLSFPATAVAVIAGVGAVPADGSANASAPAEGGAAPAPGGTAPAPAGGDAITVYVSISANGVLEIASQPVQITTYTVEEALKEAHRRYHPDGEAAFGAGIDTTYFMYMINTVWGVKVTPYVVLNDAPLGSGSNSAYISADTCPVKEGDNIIVVADAMGLVPAVSLKLDENGLVMVNQWALDFTTFQYTNAAIENADIIDAATGEVLGTTNALGNARLNKQPSCGVVAYQGVGALRVTDNVENFESFKGEYVPPAHDYSIFGGEDGKSLLRICIIGGGLALPLLIVVLYAHNKEVKTGGIKYADMRGHNEVTKKM